MRIPCELFERAEQPRRQFVTDPEHRIRRSQRAGIRWLQAMPMGGRSGRNQNIWRADAIHDPSDQTLHGCNVGHDTRGLCKGRNNR